MFDTRKLLMTQKEIKEYNQEILRYKHANVIDLHKAPLKISAREVLTKIEKYEFGSCKYINGKILDASTKEKLKDIRNIDKLVTRLRAKEQYQETLEQMEASSAIVVLFGIIISPADVRGFPTTDVLMESKEQWRFDYFQESKLQVGEGVCIYHQTEDEQWLFVQGRNYAGWIERKQVAICSRNEMLQRIDSLEKTWIPYTTENVIKQALRYINVPYSWGNKGKGIDCSGLVNGVYEKFGFSLPRNTASMAACKELLIDVKNRMPYEKKQVLKQVLPGSLLLMKGHVMLYLMTKTSGKEDCVYALHAFSKYFDEEGKRQEVMTCAITSLDIKREDGSSFLESIHSIWELFPRKSIEKDRYQV